VIEVLAPAISVSDRRRAVMAAMVCGAMVEQGADPAPLAGPLLARLRSLVPAAREFHEACVALVPADADDRARAWDAARRAMSPVMPQGAAAWDLLQELFPPAVASFVASPEVRERARDALLTDLQAMADGHAGAGWLTRLLKVLHEEPYVAIEPVTETAILGRMSGIADNFQLHVLLMDVFPRRGLQAYLTRPVSRSAAEVARGDRAVQMEETIVGKWNLYAWTALRPDGGLPEPKDLDAVRQHAVWNEGTPADIPLFDGRRVILMGPPSYSRTWRSMRAFPGLRAALTVEQVLKPDQVRQWLDRLATAER
jgi:hypothetical protein